MPWLALSIMMLAFWCFPLDGFGFFSTCKNIVQVPPFGSGSDMEFLCIFGVWWSTRLICALEHFCLGGLGIHSQNEQPRGGRKEAPQC